MAARREWTRATPTSPVPPATATAPGSTAASWTVTAGSTIEGYPP